MAKPSRSTISSLSLNSSNVSIAGLLIAKSDVRLFSRSSSSASRSSSAATRPFYRPGSNDGYNSNHSVDQQPLRGVITFTIRDSQRSFMNCVIWGTDSFVESYNMSFHVGDSVNVMRPLVTIRKNGEEYNPMCSSPFSLTINEGTSDIVAFRPEEDGDPNEFRGLLNVPIKATSAALQLADINADSTVGGGSMVDLLVVVRTIRPVKTIRSQRNGEGQERLLATVIVMDQSSAGVQLNIWNQAFVKRSQSWLAMSTVLQLIDVRSAYSKFSKSVELSTHGRTLIIENPKTREFEALIAYLSTISLTDLPSGGNDSTAICDVAAITTVMTIKQIYDRMESEQSGNELTAVLYAIIETFDLDGFGKVFTRRCTQCKRQMSHTAELCQSEDCVILRSEWMNNSAGPTEKYADTYDLMVDLTDHTGSLRKCHIGAGLAENMLGHSLDVFAILSSERRGEIKWKWLLERCTVKLVVKRKSVVRSQPMICVVDCVVAKQSDVLGHIKMY